MQVQVVDLDVCPKCGSREIDDGRFSDGVSDLVYSIFGGENYYWTCLGCGVGSGSPDTCESYDEYFFNLPKRQQNAILKSAVATLGL